MKRKREKLMTEAEKSLLVKYRQQGKGCAEIARLLNVSANTVKILSAKEPGGCRRGSGCSSGSGESQSTEGMLQTVVASHLRRQSIRGRNSSAPTKCRLQWWQ